MSEGGNYTFPAYLRGKMSFIIATVAFGLFMTPILMVLGVSRDAIIMLDLMLVACLCVALAWDFYHRRKYWNNLTGSLDAMDKVEEFRSSMRDPLYAEEEIVNSALDELAACAVAEIGDLRYSTKANSEYIEQWIHEIKTPIATSRLILDQEHGEQADSLNGELERIERLVEQALFAARTESLSNDYAIRDTSLLELVRDVCKSNMRLLTAKGVGLDIKIPQDTIVLADKTWLEFVITQVVVNSAKYDATKIEFIIEETEGEEPSKNLVLAIKDDGCGIPAQDVPRVFDRGFTGEVGRSHASATGMGLYLAARMCEKMGIGISLKSEEGVGTTVCLTFPQDRQRRRLSRKLTFS